MFGLNLSETKGKIVAVIVIAVLVVFAFVVIYGKHLKAGPEPLPENKALQDYKSNHPQ